MVSTQGIQMLSVAAVCILVFLLRQGADGRPGYQTIATADYEPDICQLNDATNTLCQKCAKSTKSNIVFPMCCHNTEQVMDWCDRYINFGIQ